MRGQGHVHGKKRPVALLFTGIVVEIIFRHQRVPVEVIEILFDYVPVFVAPVQRGHVLQKMRRVEAVIAARAVGDVAVVKAFGVGVEIVCRISRGPQNVGQGKGKVGLLEFCGYVVLRVDRIASQNGHRLRMIGLIPRVIFGERNSAVGHGVKRGGVFLINAVPLPRLDDDQYDIFSVQHARVEVVPVGRFAHLPLRKIVVQRQKRLPAVRLPPAEQGIERIGNIHEIEPEKPEFFKGLRGNKLSGV